MALTGKNLITTLLGGLKQKRKELMTRVRFLEIIITNSGSDYYYKKRKKRISANKAYRKTVCQTNTAEV